MGGRSSRPAEMSARAVLARRRLDENSLQDLHPGNLNNVVGGIEQSTEVSTAAISDQMPFPTSVKGKIDLDINPSLLDSLSKMSMITSKNEPVKL